MKTGQQSRHARPGVAGARRRADQHARDVDRPVRRTCGWSSTTRCTRRARCASSTTTSKSATCSTPSMPNEPGSLGARAEAARRRRHQRRLRVRQRHRSHADGRRGHRRRRCPEGVVRRRHLTPRIVDDDESCDCSCPRWTRFSSSSTPTGAFDSTTRTGRTPSVQERRAIIHAAKDRARTA